MTLVLKMTKTKNQNKQKKPKTSLRTPYGHMSTMSCLEREGEGAKQERKRAHKVQTVEPGHREVEKKTKEERGKKNNSKRRATKENKNVEKRQRETWRMGFSGYHLLVFSRGRLLF